MGTSECTVKAGAYLSGASRAEVNGSRKRSSLLLYGDNYGRTIFYSIGSKD